MRKIIKFNDFQIKEIIDRYKNGQSTNSIAPLFGVDSSRIYAIVKRHGISRTKFEAWKLKRSLNENVFSERNENSCYWAGFIAADGNVIGNNLRIELSIKDKNHLEKFRKFLNSKNKISERNHGYSMTRSASFSVHSEKIINDLLNFGITCNKTMSLKAINPDKHFWRGIVDGDGCLSYSGNYPQICLVGSKFIIEQFLEFCKIIHSSIRASVRKSDAIFCTTLTGNTAIAIIRELYKDSNIFLDRKMERAKIIMEK